MACIEMQQGQYVNINKMKEEAERTLKNNLDRLKKIRRAKELAKSKTMKEAVARREKELAESLKVYNPTSRFTDEEALERILSNIKAGSPAQTNKVGDGPGHVHVFRWNDGTQVPVSDVVYVKVQVQVNVNH